MLRSITHTHTHMEREFLHMASRVGKRKALAKRALVAHY